MKRLGMNFEPAPDRRRCRATWKCSPARSAPPPKNAMPRWWMAPHYEPLLKDDDGLAWQLRGSGVQTLTEDGYLSPPAASCNARPRRPARQKMGRRDDQPTTIRWPKRCPSLPSCATAWTWPSSRALFVKEDLPAKAGCDLSLLLDEKRLAVAEYHVPQNRRLPGQPDPQRPKLDPQPLRRRPGRFLVCPQSRRNQPDLSTTRQSAAAPRSEPLVVGLKPPTSSCPYPPAAAPTCPTWPLSPRRTARSAAGRRGSRGTARR